MPRDRIVPLIIAVALFMENMDSTVIATSLPAIAADIGTNPLALKLAVTSYLLSLAIFIPASGWTADRFGARTVFRAAIAVFVLGSIGCALSGSLTDFVIARIVQGMGGAMMTPVGRMVLVRTISKRELVGAMAWVTTPALIGPVLGPPVGGFITTYATWHWIFIINVPIGLLGILLATRFIPDVRAEKHERFRRCRHGSRGARHCRARVWSFGARAEFPAVDIRRRLVVGGGAISSPPISCTRAAPTIPALDLSLFRLPTFFASVVGGFIFRLGLGALPFLLPLMLQIGFGMTPFQSGMITFATALGAMGMKWSTTTHFAAFRVSQYSGHQLHDQRGLSCRVRRLHCRDADIVDDDPPADRRLFPFAAIYEHQYDRLCRCRSRPDKQGDCVGQRGATIGHLRRRCHRGHGGGACRLLQRRRSASSQRFPAGISGSRSNFGALGFDLRKTCARSRCRDGGSASDTGGAIRPARRLARAAKSCGQEIQLGKSVRLAGGFTCLTVL